jgi:hypothetical protein
MARKKRANLFHHLPPAQGHKLSGRKASRTPKGFNTSTLFKSAAVTNLLVLPRCRFTIFLAPGLRKPTNGIPAQAYSDAFS